MVEIILFTFIRTRMSAKIIGSERRIMVICKPGSLRNSSIAYVFKEFYSLKLQSGSIFHYDLSHKQLLYLIVNLAVPDFQKLFLSIALLSRIESENSKNFSCFISSNHRISESFTAFPQIRRSGLGKFTKCITKSTNGTIADIIRNFVNGFIRI